MRSLKGTYYITVVVDKQSDKILATGSLVLELKFLRGAGTIGHIEDIAVRKDAQGKKLGLHIIKSLAHISEKVGCYKSILDCSEDNKGESGRLDREIQLANAYCGACQGSTRSAASRRRRYRWSDTPSSREGVQARIITNVPHFSVCGWLSSIGDGKHATPRL